VAGGGGWGGAVGSGAGSRLGCEEGVAQLIGLGSGVESGGVVVRSGRVAKGQWRASSGE
jgi:hypothetical protein